MAEGLGILHGSDQWLVADLARIAENAGPIDDGDYKLWRMSPDASAATFAGVADQPVGMPLGDDLRDTQIRRALPGSSGPEPQL
jgi:hypothetical protein